MRIFHAALIVFVLFWIGTILFRPMWERPKFYDTITTYNPKCEPFNEDHSLQVREKVKYANRVGIRIANLAPGAGTWENMVGIVIE